MARRPQRRNTSITVRNLPPEVKERLRVRAARHGRSMAAEARAILEAEIGEPSSSTANLFDSIRSRVAKLGGVDLEPPARGPAREPPRFEE